MPDRRIDYEARKRLEQVQIGYERFAHRVYLILAVLVAVQLGIGALSLYLLGQNRERSSQVARIVDQIQRERARNILAACEDQNKRNGDTKAEVERLASRAPARPDREERIAATNLLIDRLAPVRNCPALVARQVGATP